MAIHVQPVRKQFSVDEYEKMIEAGVFDEDARLEVVRGEILESAPIGLRHSVCVARLTMLLARNVGDSAIVWVQNPI